MSKIDEERVKDLVFERAEIPEKYRKDFKGRISTNSFCYAQAALHLAINDLKVTIKKEIKSILNL